MERKKFTTTLTPRAFIGLDMVRDIYGMTNRNDAIEFLVNEFLRNNNLEETVNDIFKKNNRQK